MGTMTLPNKFRFEGNGSSNSGKNSPNMIKSALPNNEKLNITHKPFGQQKTGFNTVKSMPNIGMYIKPQLR